MLGIILSLLSAATFAVNAAAARRAVLTGTPVQGLAVTIPLGVPIMASVAWAIGELQYVLGLPLAAIGWFALAGVMHFVIGRFFNYAANGAIGTNLAAPIFQGEVLVTLILAMLVLGEQLTPLRALGILLILIGPGLVLNRDSAKGGAVAKPAAAFEPRYVEGYTYATLGMLAYGSSPLFIGLGFKAAGATVGLAAALVSYLGALTAVMAFLLITGRFRSSYAVNTTTLRWFVFAGVFVCLSHVFRYAAFAVAPVSVVTTLQRLSSIFRIYLGWLINREHEVFDNSVIVATVVSTIGAILLSISTETFLALAAWPDWLVGLARLSWP